VIRLDEAGFEIFYDLHEFLFRSPNLRQQTVPHACGDAGTRSSALAPTLLSGIQSCGCDHAELI
ncbi:MAG: hypothetical protein ACREDR_06580, partial [Blastocatellia bacterium]